MAISWGSYDSNLRVGVEVSQSPTTITSSTTSVTVTTKWYVGTTSGGYDWSDAQTLNYSGAISGTTSYTNNLTGAGEYMLVATKTDTVTLTRGSTQSKTYKATVSGAWNGATPSKSVTVTIPARPYDKPAQPTGLGVTRNSDTSHQITWTRNATSDAPYESQQIQRRRRNADGWDDWSTVGTATTRYTGTGTNAYTDSTAVNRVYRWRVRPVNDAGTSTSAVVGDSYTTPNAPASCIATKMTAGGIRVVMVPNAYAATPNINFEIQYQQDGGSWTALTTIDGGDTGSYYYDDSSTDDGSTYRYRARAVIDDSSAATGNGLTSAWTYSSTVELAAAPNAPAVSVSPVVVDLTETTPTVAWVHNPTDSSEQSAYNVRIRVEGTSTWTELGQTSGTVSSLDLADLLTTLDPGNGVTVEVQVQTWGAHADASPWSDTVTFVTSARPTVTISAPEADAVVDVSTLVAQWSYYDAEDTAQTAWQAVLYAEDGTTALESRSGSGTADTTTFTYPLADGGAYVLAVRVQDGSGLWSAWDTVPFTVDFLPPAVADVTGACHIESGTVVLDISTNDPVDGESVEAVYVTIQRSIDGGPWVTIADRIDANTTFVDTAPTLNGWNAYRFILYSEEGTSVVIETQAYDAEADYSAMWCGDCATACAAEEETPPLTPVEDENGDETGEYTIPVVAVRMCEGERGFLSTGDAFESVLVVLCDLTLSASVARQKALFHFAGRDLPVEFSSEAIDRVVTVGGTVVDGFAAVESAALTEGIVLWRDPTGRRMFASIGPLTDTNLAAFVPNVWSFGFTLTEVDHEG